MTQCPRWSEPANAGARGPARKDAQSPPWRAPTRRAFVAMIGAAAAALTVRDPRKPADPPRSTSAGPEMERTSERRGAEPTRWIGHC